MGAHRAEPGDPQGLRARAGLSVDDLDAIEVNEAFASIAMAWAREFQPDPAKLNPRGGAIALGHPLGASGVRLMTTMLHYLEDTGGRLGLQTMCEGGGQANVTIIERLELAPRRAGDLLGRGVVRDGVGLRAKAALPAMKPSTSWPFIAAMSPSDGGM